MQISRSDLDARVHATPFRTSVKQLDLPNKKKFDFDLMSLRTIIGPKLHTVCSGIIILVV